MLQFYFLAVLLNVMAGLILVYAADFTRGTSLGAPADGMADDMDAGDAAAMKPKITQKMVDQTIAVLIASRSRANFLAP